MTFSGVASNFAGVPLAFAFMATLGASASSPSCFRSSASTSTPPVSELLIFFALTLTYLYFQIPLIVLIMTPAIDGLSGVARGERNPGCHRCDIGAMSPAGFLAEFFRRVAAAVCQLFRRHRHRFALTGSSLDIVTILLYAQIWRRRASRPESRRRTSTRHVPDHRPLEPRLSLLGAPQKVAQVNSGKFGASLLSSNQRGLFLRAADRHVRFSMAASRHIYFQRLSRRPTPSALPGFVPYSTVLALATISSARSRHADRLLGALRLRSSAASSNSSPCCRWSSRRSCWCSATSSSTAVRRSCP